VSGHRLGLGIALAAWLTATAALGAPATPPAPEPPPGTPAPPHVIHEIRRSLHDAVHRFDAMDAAGVLAHVSDRYRTGPLTKPLLAEQLRALFTLHDQVKAHVRIDEVRLVGDHAWVYSTGGVTGRVRWIGGSVPVLSWQRELEVARLEDGRWRLFGYQQ